MNNCNNCLRRKVYTTILFDDTFPADRWRLILSLCLSAIPFIFVTDAVVNIRPDFDSTREFHGEIKVDTRKLHGAG